MEGVLKLNKSISHYALFVAIFVTLTTMHLLKVYYKQNKVAIIQSPFSMRSHNNTIFWIFLCQIILQKSTMVFSNVP